MKDTQIMANIETTTAAPDGADPFPTSGPLAQISMRCSDVEQVAGLVEMCGGVVHRETTALERLHPEAPVQCLQTVAEHLEFLGWRRHTLWMRPWRSWWNCRSRIRGMRKSCSPSCGTATGTCPT